MRRFVARPLRARAGQTASTSIAGAFTRCFFTAHWSVARTMAARYFSGNPSGSFSSIRIFEMSFVSGRNAPSPS